MSHVKVGPFKSPSVRKGHADAGLFLASTNVDVHKDFLKPGGLVFVNTTMTGDYMGLDATGLAKENGSIIITNLVLLGYAVRQGGLFCDEDLMRSVIHKVSNSKNLDMNLKGFEAGFNYQGGVK